MQCSSSKSVEIWKFLLIRISHSKLISQILFKKIKWWTLVLIFKIVRPGLTMEEVSQVVHPWLWLQLTLSQVHSSGPCDGAESPDTDTDTDSATYWPGWARLNNQNGARWTSKVTKLTGSDGRMFKWTLWHRPYEPYFWFFVQVDADEALNWTLSISTLFIGKKLIAQDGR